MTTLIWSAQRRDAKQAWKPKNGIKPSWAKAPQTEIAFCSEMPKLINLFGYCLAKPWAPIKVAWSDTVTSNFSFSA